MRQDYVMTKTFRDFTSGLDLVAANDLCDGEKGSDQLVNADLKVVDKSGSFFVDVNGNPFTNSITVVLTGADVPPNPNFNGKQYAKITIPDAELFKISKPITHNGELTDTRELFIGLLDMLPTGTRVVDSASQQIAIQLTRTQYGTFSAYGEHNIDYDFISYLNARVHKVFSTTPFPSPRRDGLYPAQHFLEITYVYDDRLMLNDESNMPVADLSSASLSMADDEYFPCDSEGLAWGFEPVTAQACGPTALGFSSSNKCPQVSLPDDKFGRIYIPLPNEPEVGVVSVSFDLSFVDGENRTASLEVSMDIVVDSFVSWCDEDVGSIDLAERVIPAITIGSETNNPARIYGFERDTPDFSTGAETLQDGLITLELSLNETDGLDENLEVFMEDVLVIQINPGSPVDAATIKSDSDYIPTYQYDPDSRDAWMIIPDALKEDCPQAEFSESFFGCVHKHVLRDEEVEEPKEWAHIVGTNGAQDFMEAILGSGTASVSARELGRDYEEALLADGFATRKKIGLWINPGHKWGQTVHNSKYSLTENVVIYVLFGVRSGVDGSARRMLLQVGGDSSSKVLRAPTLKYDVTAAELVERVLEDVVAVEVQATLSLSNAEACQSEAALLAMCAQKLEAAVRDHASSDIKAVHCLSVTIDGADCSGARRAAASPTAMADAVIALEDAKDAHIDMAAVVTSGAVLSMSQTSRVVFTKDQTGGTESPEPTEPTEGVDAPAPAAEDSSVNGLVIGAAAGAGVGVLLLALLAWKARKGFRTGSHQPVYTGVAETRSDVENPKARLEALMFNHDDVGVVARK